MQTLESSVNQIIQGDCVEVMRLLPGQSIDLAITDPPYLVNYRPRDGRQCANDDSDHWLKPAFQELYRVLKPNSFCMSFYGWPWVDRFMQVWKECGFRPVSHLIGVKSHCSREGYTKGFHEVGYLLAKGKPAWARNSPSDVLPWEYTGNQLHPNQKPIVAITPLIEAFSKPGDIILDPFAGSGTTAISALRSNRNFILIEKEDHYCQAARHRLNNKGNAPAVEEPSVPSARAIKSDATRMDGWPAERERL